LKYLKDNAFIRTQNRSDRKVNGNTVTRWFEDKNQRVVCLDIAKIGSSEGFEDYDQLNFQTVLAEEVVPY
jgi:hypothetical protein